VFSAGSGDSRVPFQKEAPPSIYPLLEVKFSSIPSTTSHCHGRSSLPTANAATNLDMAH
jgi:hypothetical protein